VTRSLRSRDTAEKLSEELTEKYFSPPDKLNDGKQWYTAIDISEPAGKLLKDCKKRRIKLPANCLEDLRFKAKSP